MNTPVSFKLAKLLKEKGFNKKTIKFYTINSEFYPDGTLHVSTEDPFSNVIYETLQDERVDYKWIVAPTIAEVVMWLFESHNIWIYLTREPITNTFGPVINTETKSIYFNNQSTVSRVTGQKYDPWYNKPENGYQRAIEYVLTEMI